MVVRFDALHDQPNGPLHSGPFVYVNRVERRAQRAIGRSVNRREAQQIGDSMAQTGYCPQVVHMAWRGLWSPRIDLTRRRI